MLCLYPCHPSLALLLKIHKVEMHLLNVRLQVLQDAVCSILMPRHAISGRFCRHLGILHGEMIIDFHRYLSVLHLIALRIFLLILYVLHIALKGSNSITSVILFLNHHADIGLVNFGFTAITIIMDFDIIAEIQLMLDSEGWRLTERELINDFNGCLRDFVLLLWILIRKNQNYLKEVTG